MRTNVSESVDVLVIGAGLSVPRLDRPGIGREPIINLASGYVRRSIDDFPAQGSERPWRVHQNYALDALELRLGRIDDGVLCFSPGRRRAAEPVAV
jgi:hypothetical protein